MKHIADNLAAIPVPTLFGTNLGIVGLVHVSDLEIVLKIAVLLATLALTLLTGWIKWRNRDKPHD